MHRPHVEEDDGAGEQVGFVAFVWLLQNYFGSHEAWRPYNRFIYSLSLFSRQRSRKTEVYDLQIKIAIEKEIGGFQIAMGIALGVDVAEAAEELLEEVSASLLGEGA